MIDINYMYIKFILIYTELIGGCIHQQTFFGHQLGTNKISAAPSLLFEPTSR